MAVTPEIAELKKDLDSVRNELSRLGRLADAFAARIASAEAREQPLPTQLIPPVEGAAAASPPVAPPTPRPSAPTASPELAAAGAEPPAPPARSAEDLAWVVLNRVGVVAVFLGIAFFLKYAFDNDWIGPWGRVAIGIVSGAVLLALGEWQQSKKHALFGQSLTGGGIAVLYVSFFATFGFYKLLDASTAFVLMALVTATSCVAALRYRSLAIAVLGLIGGFLTPPLLSTGVDRQVALFSYVALLDAAALVLAVRHGRERARWRALALIALLGTLVLLLGWTTEFYASEKLTSTLLINVLFCGAFALFPAVDARRRRSPVPARVCRVDIAILLLGAAYFVPVCWWLISDYHAAFVPDWATNGAWLVRYPLRAWVGLVPLGFAALQIAGVATLRARGRTEEKALLVVQLALALLGFVLVPPAQWSGAQVSIAWTVEVALLILAARETKQRPLLITAAALWAFALLVACVADHDAAPRTSPLSSTATAAYVWCAAAAWLMRWATRPNRGWAWITAAAMHLSVLLALSVETYAWAQRSSNGLNYPFDENAGQMALSILWACYGVALAVGGFVRGERELRVLGLVLLAVTAAKVFLVDLSTLPVAYRIFSFLGLGILSVGGSYVYLRSQERRRHASHLKGEGT